MAVQLQLLVFTHGLVFQFICRRGRNRLAWPGKHGRGPSKRQLLDLRTCSLRRAQRDGPACLVFQVLRGGGDPLREAAGEQPEQRAKTPGVTLMCKLEKA